jgi:hypothetical protein
MLFFSATGYVFLFLYLENANLLSLDSVEDSVWNRYAVTVGEWAGQSLRFGKSIKTY